MLKHILQISKMKPLHYIQEVLGSNIKRRPAVLTDVYCGLPASFSTSWQISG